MKPTEMAKSHFDSAARGAGEASNVVGRLGVDANGRVIQLNKTEHGLFLLAGAVRQLAKGLEDLTTGVRATYILLDEVNRKLPK